MKMKAKINLFLGALSMFIFMISDWFLDALGAGIGKSTFYSSKEEFVNEMQEQLINTILNIIFDNKQIN